MPHNPIDDKDYSLESRIMYGKDVSERWSFKRHVIPPISMSTNFRFETAQEGRDAFACFGARVGGEERDSFNFIYDRLDEPNKNLLEENLAIAEEGDLCLVYATGMAAIAACINSLIGPGDEIIAHAPVYGCTDSLLRNWLRDKWNLKVRFESLSDPQVLDELITNSTRLLYLESPANPNCSIIDIKGVTDKVKKLNEKRKKHIYTVIDNTFASPFCQRPLNYGVDFVVHSLTKFIGGFGTVMGGTIVARKENIEPMGRMMLYRKDYGGALSPTNAWHILVYGLSTIALRLRREVETAQKVAEWLEKHPKVARVSYPGLKSHPQYKIAKQQMIDMDGNFSPGAMIYLLLDGKTDEEMRTRGIKMMNYVADNAYTMTLAVSLGQIRTLIEHPAGMTHFVVPDEVKKSQGIDAGGIRLAIGIEPAEDIIRDLERALKEV